MEKEKIQNIKRAAVYCRVSTETEMQEGSFAYQRNYYLEKINATPAFVLVDVYGDFGKSGTSIQKRPEFQRMLQDCSAGKIDVIFTKSISRFSRNLADCVEVIRRLKKKGIAVIFEKENINTMDSSSELLLSILAIIAQEESNSLSQNLRWSLQKFHANGVPTGSVTYGYRRVMPENIWTIEETEAKRVRLAFESAAEGICYQQIAAGLDSIEKTEGSTYRWKNQNRIRYMLRNINYTGDVLTDKYYTNGPGRSYEHVNHGERDQYYIEQHHEPIISRKLYDRVQLLMDCGLLHSLKKKYTEEEKALLADQSWRA